MLKKIVIIYSILALLAIIAAVGAGLWCQKNSNSGSIVAVDKDMEVVEETTSGEIISTEKTDCTDELDTACWNTYINKEYGFSFKYPEGWEVDDVSFGANKIALFLPRKLTPPQIKVTDVLITIDINNSHLLLEDFYKDGVEGINYFNDALGEGEKITVNGKDGWYFKDVLGMVGTNVAVMPLRNNFIRIESINY